MPLDTPIRGCESAVLGTLASNWRDTAIIAGPLGWPGIVGYANQPAADFSVQNGRYFLQKALARRRARCTREDRRPRARA